MSTWHTFWEAETQVWPLTIGSNNKINDAVYHRCYLHSQIWVSFARNISAPSKTCAGTQRAIPKQQKWCTCRIFSRISTEVGNFLLGLPSSMKYESSVCYNTLSPSWDRCVLPFEGTLRDILSQVIILNAYHNCASNQTREFLGGCKVRTSTCYFYSNRWSGTRQVILFVRWVICALRSPSYGTRCTLWRGSWRLATAQFASLLSTRGWLSLGWRHYRCSAAHWRVS